MNIEHSINHLHFVYAWLILTIQGGLTCSEHALRLFGWDPWKISSSEQVVLLEAARKELSHILTLSVNPYQIIPKMLYTCKDPIQKISRGVNKLKAEGSVSNCLPLVIVFSHIFPSSAFEVS